MIDYEQHPRILLFDGVCNLCNTFVQFAIKRDPKGRFKFAALQSETGIGILNDFGLDSKSLNTFVAIIDGRPLLRSDAALQTLRQFGLPWKLVYSFILIPRPIRDFLYDLVARTRYSLFGKQSQCMVPTAELKSRFL